MAHPLLSQHLQESMNLLSFLYFSGCRYFPMSQYLLARRLDFLLNCLDCALHSLLFPSPLLTAQTTRHMINHLHNFG